MLDRLTRPFKKRVFAPLVKILPAVDPNQVTLFGFLLGLGAVLFAWWGWPSWTALFFGGNRIIDGLDGELARGRGVQTDVGGYLDILADVAIYGLLPLGLVLARPSQPLFVMLAILLISYYLNTASWIYLAAILEKQERIGERDTTIVMPVGLIGGTETVLFYFGFILLPNYLSELFFLFAGLVFVTVGQRVIWARKNI